MKLFVNGRLWCSEVFDSLPYVAPTPQAKEMVNTVAEGKRVVLLLSGGLDSSLSLAELLAKPVSEVERVQCLTFDYGQSSKAEIKKAEQLCKWWKVPHDVRKLDIPGGSDTHLEIPVRNLIFLCHAATLAIAQNFNCIALGTEPDSTYTDSTVEFARKANDLFQSFNLQLLTPVKFYQNKFELVTRALDLGLPLHLCHSSRSDEVDGKCKTSSLFLNALSRIFPHVLPIHLLQMLSELDPRWEPSTDTYYVRYLSQRDRRVRSFKYPAAYFTLAQRGDWSSVSKVSVFSTGTWMADMKLAAEAFGVSDCFDYIYTESLQELMNQKLNCDSIVAQWGLKQAFAFLPRPRTLKSVACRVVQGHLSAALQSLGYSVELPAHRRGALLETSPRSSYPEYNLNEG